MSYYSDAKRLTNDTRPGLSFFAPNDGSVLFFQAEDGIRDYRCDWSSDVCSSDRSEEHTSGLQSHDNLVCRIIRSEEHTSELQSHDNLVCRLLLEKKKKKQES